MRTIALVDLDDTLFQTLRKCPAGIALSDLTPLGFKSDGTPNSFATRQQMAFIEWLFETTHVVPVTARSLAALRRVRLPFTSAVCAHGGLILADNGAEDQTWNRHIQSASRDTHALLQILVDALEVAAKEAQIPVKVSVAMEGETALYAMARHVDADEVALSLLADKVSHLIPGGWTDHRNSNVIAFLPPFLAKQHGVAHILPGLRARFADAMIIGIGDSITDAPFMDLCDFAMTPSGSQLARAAKIGGLGL